MDKFKLEIELGNEAMQTPENVAQALREVATWLDGIGSYPTGDYGDISEDQSAEEIAEQVEAADSEIKWHLDAGSVRDLNGNTVGEWEAK